MEIIYEKENWIESGHCKESAITIIVYKCIE